MIVLTHYDDGKKNNLSHEVSMKFLVEHDTLDMNGSSYPSSDFICQINLTSRTTSYGRTFDIALDNFKAKLASRIQEMQLFYDSLNTISPIEIDSCGQIIEKENDENG